MRLSLRILFIISFAVTAIAQTAKVTHVSDGDSFILASGERVRMIGINSPELADKFGAEAKEHLARLIRGKTVTLEREPANDDRDIHGRLLRFVSLDSVDINRQMIADGWAYAFLRYPFAREKRDSYRDAERAAKESRLGIWGTEPVEVDRNSNASSTPGAPPEPATDLSDRSLWKRMIAGGVLILILWLLRRLLR